MEDINPDNKNFINKLRNHVTSSVINTPLEFFPFPYIYVENIFPDEVYKKIIEYDPFNYSDGKGWFEPPNPYHKRRQFNFPDDIVDSELAAILPNELKMFWQTVLRAMMEDNFWPDLIYKKFPEYFNLRFGSLMLDKDRWSYFKELMFVQKHKGDFSLGPHTDIPTRVVTAIFNFADCNNFSRLGTHLYEPKNKFHRCSGKKHHDFTNFNEVGFSKYLPNSAFIFFKTAQSFHAVHPAMSELNKNQRFSGQIQFYENGNYNNFLGCGGNYIDGRSIFDDLSFDNKE